MLSAIRFSALLLCLIFCMASCKKEDSSPFPTPLPAATQVGANTFGCRINGKTWIPDGGGGFSGIKPIEGGYLYTKKNIYINTYRRDKTKIEIYLPNTVQTGTYELNNNTGLVDVDLNPKRYAFYKDADDNYYITNSQYTGQITITQNDTVRGIISGTFNFTAYSPNSKQTIRITDGRFDIESRR